MIQSFVEQWRTDNPRLFDNIMSMKLGVFTEAEVDTYRWDFLKEAFSLLESLRMNSPTCKSESFFLQTWLTFFLLKSGLIDLQHPLESVSLTRAFPRFG